MIKTRLFEFILERANEVKCEFGSETLYASHVAVAVADFVKEKYFGLSDWEGGCPRFEEERLRYLFSKVVKLSSYFRMRCKHNAKDQISEEPFSMEKSEQIALLRGIEILSSDLLFLSALNEIHPIYKPNLKMNFSDETVINLLQDADQNIYDYVIERIGELCAKLQDKAEEAAKIRDWKPAKKFAEPEAVFAHLVKGIQCQVTEKEITLRFLKFFGSSDLKISVHQVGELYYVHDHGSAIKHLSRRVGDPKKMERALKKVCHSDRIRKGAIIGCFARSGGFYEYLKSLIFVAHSDLYYTKAEGLFIPKEKDCPYVGIEQADPIDQEDLMAELKSGLGFSYDENQGVYCWVDAKCSLSSARMFFLSEVLENEKIRISDRRKGEYEGEIFEKFYWNHDDITPYAKFVHSLAERFGAEFDGRDLYLTEKSENFSKAIFRFFNLAVLISEFGDGIALPKVRGKAK